MNVYGWWWLIPTCQTKVCRRKGVIICTWISQRNGYTMASLYSGSSQRRRVIFIQRTGSDLNPACKQLKRAKGEGQYYLKQGFPVQESRLSSRELITQANFCICLFRITNFMFRDLPFLQRCWRRDVSSDTMLSRMLQQVSTFRIKCLLPSSGSIRRKIQF